MKKTIMALLLAVLLVTVLAVPAMAEEVETHCVCGATTASNHMETCPNVGTATGIDTTWQPWDGSTALETGKNYYLTTDLQITSAIAVSGTISLDLHGHTIAASSTTKPEYLFDVTHNNGTIFSFTDTVGTGKLDWTYVNTAYGGAFFLKTATVNMYGGTITGDPATKSFYTGGAAVCLSSSGSGTFNMYGGTMSNGKVSSTPTNNGGGNVLMRAGTFHMYGGTISGGQSLSSTRGGNIYIGSGTFTIHTDHAKISGGTSAAYGGSIYATGANAKLNIDGGTISGGNSTNRGGNIYIGSGAQMKMTDGTVSGGNSAAGGGNIYVNGSGTQLTMNDGIIENGVVTGANVHGGNIRVDEGAVLEITSGIIRNGRNAATGDSNGGNIAIVGASTVVNISGDAQILGGYANRGGSIFLHNGKLNISGSAQITGGSASGVTNGYGTGICVGSTATVADRMTVNGKPVIDNVFINAAGTTMTVGELEEGAYIGLTMKADASGLVATGVSDSDLAYIVSVGRTKTLDASGNLTLGALGNIYHCVCGKQHYASAEEGAEVTVSYGDCIAPCNGAVETWTPVTSGTVLPTAGGYYYLTRTVTVDDVMQIGDDTAHAHVYLDLNGQTVTNEANSDYRIYRTKYNSDTTLGFQYSLTIADSSKLQNGNMTPVEKTTSNAGMIFWAATSNGTLNIYGGKLDASKLTITANGAAISTVGPVNMYGGTIIGAKSANYGGAIYMTGSSVFTMKDGSIIGGTVTEGGGAVNLDGSSQFIMENGTIDGGTAKYGGAVRLNASGTKFTMNSGTVIGGSSVNGGSAFSNGGTLTVNDGKIYGGNSTGVDTGNAAIGGGAINQAKTFTMTGGEIIGGTAANGHGGCINVRKGTTTTLSGNVKISGGTDANGNPNNLYLQDGATITITGTLSSGSSIGISMKTPGDFTPAMSGNGKDANLSYFTSDNDTYFVRFVDGKLRLDPYAELYHCVCGAKQWDAEGNQTKNEECHSTCNGSKQTWKPWAYTTTAPYLGGYWYIYSDINLNTNYKHSYSDRATPWHTNTAAIGWDGKGNPIASSVAVHVDLNGKTITGNVYERVFRVETENSYTLTLTDAVGGGKITSASGTCSLYGHLIWIRNVKGTVNIYPGVTLDNAAVTNTAADNGGSVAYSAGTVNLYGGTVIGGKAIYGGAISNAGTLNISGSTSITGGTATTAGDNIYSTGTVKVSGTPTIEEIYSTKVGGITVGELGEGASIGLNAAAAQKMTAAAVPYGKSFFSATNTQAFQVSSEADGVYLRAADAHVHCLCHNATNLSATKNPCAPDHWDVYFDQAWDGTTALETAGNYYLSGNVSSEGAEIQVGAAVKLCLCGNSITHSAARVFYIDEDAALTVANCNETVGSISGTASSSNGGSVYVDNGGVFTLYGGSVIGGTAKQGGAIYGTGGAQVTINGGTVYAGTVSDAGGAIFMNGATSYLTLNGGDILATFTDSNGDEVVKSAGHGAAITLWNAHMVMNDGTVVGGKCTGSGGGAVSIIYGTMTMNAGTVRDGINGGLTGAAYGGGNIRVNSTATFTMNGGTVTGGTVAVSGGRGAGICVQSGGKVNLNGGTITGNTNENGVGNDIYLQGGSIVTVSGEPEIGEIYFLASSPITVGELSEEASIGLNAASGMLVTNAAVAEAVKGCFYAVDGSDYAILYSDSGVKLYIEGTLVTLNDGTESIPLAEALKAANGKKDYIKLTNTLEKDFTVTGDVFIDLNGNNITGTVIVAEGAVLKVFDSNTADYDATDRGIANIVVEDGGKLARTFNTPKATYGSNFKYLTLAEKNADGEIIGYSFHRYYLTVTTAYLAPNQAGLHYRTVFKCNDVVKDYLTDYGANVTVLKASVPVSYDGGSDLKPGGDENERIVLTKNVLTDAAMANLTTADEMATTRIPVYAYFTIDDGWTNAGEMTINSSTKSGESLFSMTDYANDNYDSLVETQKTAVQAMFNKYYNVMNFWFNDQADTAVQKIRGEFTPAENQVIHCICDNTDAEDLEESACAAAGHRQYLWEAWTKTDSLPAYGIYYLADNVNLTAQTAIADNTELILDLNGMTVTQTTNENGVFGVSGNLSITDCSDESDGKLYSTITAINTDGSGSIISQTGVNSIIRFYGGKIDATGINETGGSGYGLALRNYGGKVYLYGGEILGGAAKGSGGGAIYTGYYAGSEFNMYGGTITGGSGKNGGVMRIGSNGNVTISGGTVTGGSASTAGGTICNNGGKLTISGNATISGGTAAATGGVIRAEKGSTVIMTGGTVDARNANATNVAINGGAIFLQEADMTISGGTVYGGTVSSKAGAIYVNTGSLEISEDAQIIGSTAQYGGAIYVKTAELTMSNGSISGGTATDAGGNIYNEGGTLAISGGTVSDGTVTKEVQEATGGNIYTTGATVNISGTAQLSGGSAFNGGSIYATKSDLTMSGGSISGAKAGRGGGAIKLENASTFEMSGSASITGCTADYNGGGVFLEGSNMTMKDTATISGCTAANKGGAIIVNTSSKSASANLTLSGNAAITGNHSNSAFGGGIHCNTPVGTDTISLSGNITISDNTDAETDAEGKYKANNIYLAQDAYITVAGELTNTIGITVADGEGVFANGDYAAANVGKFVDDNAVAQTQVYNENQLRMYVGGYRVGYATKDINPPYDANGNVQGLPLMGFSDTNSRAEGQDDDDYPLQAVCLAITDDEGDTVLLFGMDTCNIVISQSDKVRKAVSDATGVPQENIIISANHQHSTPTFGATFIDTEGYVGEAGQTISYLTYVTKKCTEAAKDALKDRAEATIQTSTVNTAGKAGDNQNFNFVRNYTAWYNNKQIGMKTVNHRDYLTFSEGNWSILGDYVTLQYESEADTEMQLVKFVRSGKTTADGKAAQNIVLANFQTHPHLSTTANDKLITADVVGVFRSVLSKETGNHVIYFTGAAGNINATTEIDDDQPYTSEQYVDYGTALAAVAKSAIDDESLWDSVTPGNVSVVTETNSYTARQNTDEKTWIADTTLATAQSILDGATYTQKTHMPDGVFSYYHAKRIVERSKTDWAATRSMTLTAIDMGGIGFVAVPFEMFDTNGMEIKNGTNATTVDNYEYATKLDNPFPMTIIATLANAGSDDTGYIPSRIGYANGGYSTDITRFAKGTGEDVVTQFLQMLNTLKPTQD